MNCQCQAAKEVQDLYNKLGELCAKNMRFKDGLHEAAVELGKMRVSITYILATDDGFTKKHAIRISDCIDKAERAIFTAQFKE